jgi:ArsR family transcriptional regulator
MLMELEDVSATDACCAPLSGPALSDSEAFELAKVFKALSDPVRLRLLNMIASVDGGEACVCDLTAAFELTGPTISHHLKVLRQAGLIEGERRGTWVYYRVVPDRLTRLSGLFALPVLAPAGASAALRSRVRTWRASAATPRRVAEANDRCHSSPTYPSPGWAVETPPRWRGRPCPSSASSPARQSTPGRYPVARSSTSTCSRVPSLHTTWSSSKRVNIGRRSGLPEAMASR